jgi:hypothetical protein
MKILIKGVIEIDENMWYSHADEEEFAWFKSLLDDKSNEPMLMLWSNEVGDEIGHTLDFEYEIIERNG